MNARRGLDKPTAHGVLGSTPVRWALAAAGIACTAAHLYGIAADIFWLRAVTKPPLMLLLAAYTLSRTRPECRAQTAPLIAGLVLASAGDTALILENETAFLVGLLLFAGTHLCYIGGCFHLGAGRPLRERPLIAIVTLAAYAVATYAMWERMGDLRWPMAGYGFLLFSTVAVAFATNRGMGVGAALFAISDLTLGLRIVGLEFPGQGFFIMLTYVVGQLLIALNWRRVTAPGR